MLSNGNRLWPCIPNLLGALSLPRILSSVPFLHLLSLFNGSSKPSSKKKPQTNLKQIDCNCNIQGPILEIVIWHQIPKKTVKWDTSVNTQFITPAWSLTQCDVQMFRFHKPFILYLVWKDPDKSTADCISVAFHECKWHRVIPPLLLISTKCSNYKEAVWFPHVHNPFLHS